MGYRALLAMLLVLLAGHGAYSLDAKSEGKRSKLLTRHNSAAKKSSRVIAKSKKDKNPIVEDTQPAIPASFDELNALISTGDPNLIKSALAKHPTSLFFADAAGSNVIHRLTTENNLKLLKIVLASVAPDTACQAINTRNLSHLSPLHIAASSGLHAIAILLLWYGAWVEMPGPSTVSAFIMALNSQDIDMAHILAAWGGRAYLAPIGDQQHSIPKMRLFSATCREYYIDAFINKNQVTFDNAFTESLMEHLDRYIVDIYKQNNPTEASDQLPSPTDESTTDQD